VRAMAEDAEGALWVTGVGGPLVRLVDGHFVRPPIVKGLRTTPARSMLSSRDGAFWLSLDRTGLLRIAAGGVQVYDARQGLEAEMVYQLLEDDAGELWMGTNKSILRVSRASLDAVAEGRRSTLEVVSFESTDRRAGVVASAIRQPSAWKTRNGRLWFATGRGPLSIDPRAARPPTWSSPRGPSSSASRPATTIGSGTRKGRP
jgi:ligand-binding sensor domain-containing protein